MTIVVLEAEVDLGYVQEMGQNISEAVMDEVSYYYHGQVAVLSAPGQY